MMQISAYGRLGKDPKAIATQSGKAMTTASLAVRLDCREDGETFEGTQWLNLLAFGKVAEQLERHKGGDLLNVFGRCQLSRYETREGENAGKPGRHCRRAFVCTFSPARRQPQAQRQPGLPA